jgi:hypothetical protein
VLEKNIKDSLEALFNHTPVAVDSTKQIVQPVLSNPTEEKPKQKKPKKVVYITDYDTIVKYDTLRTKKKRK